MKLILAASGALAAYLAWRSLGWPLIHDAPLMHYIAWVIAEGGIPYRDVFDMNLPGVYLIHAGSWDAAISPGGSSIWAGSPRRARSCGRMRGRSAPGPPGRVRSCSRSIT